MNDALAELMADVLRFRDDRDWAQFHTPRNLAAALAIEVGELQELLLWKTDKDVLELLRDPSCALAVQREIADVLIYTLLMAAATNTDLVSAVREKLAHNAVNYPVARSKGHARKYTEDSLGG